MGVDVLDGEEFVERIGFDRRDGIDRGVVDKKIKTAGGRDESLAVAFEGRQIAEVAGYENRAPRSKPLVQRPRLRVAVRCRKIMQEDAASAAREALADRRADAAGAARHQRALAPKRFHSPNVSLCRQSQIGIRCRRRSATSQSYNSFRWKLARLSEPPHRPSKSAWLTRPTIPHRRRSSRHGRRPNPDLRDRRRFPSTRWGRESLVPSASARAFARYKRPCRGRAEARPARGRGSRRRPPRRNRRG